MVGLGSDGLGRGFFQRSILFEGLRVRFDVPSFRIDSRHLVSGEGRIAGHQILNTCRAICVYEDWLEQHKREIDTFQIDFPTGIGLKRHLVEPYPLTVAFGLRTQGDLTIGLERHNEILVQVVLNKQHVLSGTVPHIAQHIAKRKLVALGGAEQLSIHLVFADRRTAFWFASLRIDVGFRFRHNTEPNWQRIAVGMVQTCYEVEAFHVPVLAVVVMPADAVVLVGIGLLRAAVVNDDHPILLLDLPYIGLDHVPQFRRPKPRLTQQALNLVMADTASQQSCQSGSRRLSECTDQIITLAVQQFCVFHPFSLAHPA